MSGRAHAHGHSHGLVDRSVLRSRAGVRATLVSLGVLGLTAAVQAVVLLLSGSVALLADLIHNAGDALTAIPVGAAFLLRSERAERWAGYAVVLAIFASACVALYETIRRFLDPSDLDHLWALAGAGVVGFAGNLVAARVRTGAGRRLESAALIADGDHARIDAFVSLGVVLSAGAVALGLDVADPIIGLAITFVILRITWSSWRTVRHFHRPRELVMRAAREYDVRMWLRTRGREGTFREELVRRARVAPGEHVLDIGSGTGGTAIAAARAVGEAGTVHGIDLSDEMLARARTKARRAGVRVGFLKAPAQDLPFPGASFDVVTTALTLHHLSPEARGQALGQIARVLRPGGRVLVVDIDLHHPANSKNTAHAHAHRVGAQAQFDVADIGALFAHLGFTELDRGHVEFTIRGLERLKYVLAQSPAKPR